MANITTPSGVADTGLAVGWLPSEENYGKISSTIILPLAFPIEEYSIARADDLIQSNLIAVNGAAYRSLKKGDIISPHSGSSGTTGAGDPWTDTRTWCVDHFLYVKYDGNGNVSIAGAEPSGSVHTGRGDCGSHSQGWYTAVSFDPTGWTDVRIQVEQGNYDNTIGVNEVLGQTQTGATYGSSGAQHPSITVTVTLDGQASSSSEEVGATVVMRDYILGEDFLIVNNNFGWIHGDNIYKIDVTLSPTTFPKWEVLPRYTVNGILDTTSALDNNILILTSSNNAWLTYNLGKFAVITDDSVRALARPVDSGYMENTMNSGSIGSYFVINRNNWDGADYWEDFGEIIRCDFYPEQVELGKDYLIASMSNEDQELLNYMSDREIPSVESGLFSSFLVDSLVRLPPGGGFNLPEFSYTGIYYPDVYGNKVLTRYSDMVVPYYRDNIFKDELYFGAFNVAGDYDSGVSTSKATDEEKIDRIRNVISGSGYGYYRIGGDPLVVLDDDYQPDSLIGLLHNECSYWDCAAPPSDSNWSYGLPDKGTAPINLLFMVEYSYTASVTEQQQAFMSEIYEGHAREGAVTVEVIMVSLENVWGHYGGKEPVVSTGWTTDAAAANWTNFIAPSVDLVTPTGINDTDHSFQEAINLAMREISAKTDDFPYYKEDFWDLPTKLVWSGSWGQEHWVSGDPTGGGNAYCFDPLTGANWSFTHTDQVSCETEYSRFPKGASRLWGSKRISTSDEDINTPSKNIVHWVLDGYNTFHNNYNGASSLNDPLYVHPNMDSWKNNYEAFCRFYKVKSYLSYTSTYGLNLNFAVNHLRYNGMTGKVTLIQDINEENELWSVRDNPSYFPSHFRNPIRDVMMIGEAKISVSSSIHHTTSYLKNKTKTYRWLVEGEKYGDHSWFSPAEYLSDFLTTNGKRYDAMSYIGVKTEMRPNYVPNYYSPTNKVDHLGFPYTLDITVADSRITTSEFLDTSNKASLIKDFDSKYVYGDGATAQTDWVHKMKVWEVDHRGWHEGDSSSSTTQCDGDPNDEIGKEPILPDNTEVVAALVRLENPHPCVTTSLVNSVPSDYTCTGLNPDGSEHTTYTEFMASCGSQVGAPITCRGFMDSGGGVVGATFSDYNRMDWSVESCMSFILAQPSLWIAFYGQWATWGGFGTPTGVITYHESQEDVFFHSAYTSTMGDCVGYNGSGGICLGDYYTSADFSIGLSISPCTSDPFYSSSDGCANGLGAVTDWMLGEYYKGGWKQQECEGIVDQYIKDVNTVFKDSLNRFEEEE